MNIMNNKKLVSIIVPAYNVENYIDNCINSLINQTYNNIEIIIVDDGSTDGTLKKSMNYQKKDKRIKILKKKNGGLSSARNFGINSSKGDYITFVDSDDDVDINYIEKLVNKLESNNADISMCGRKNIYTYNNKIDVSPSICNDILLDIKSYLDNIDDPTAYGSFACCKLYKREFVINTMFDESIYVYEDNLFSLQICLQNPIFYYFDEKLYNYYIRNGSLSRKQFDQRKATGIDSLNKTIDICKNHFPEYEQKYILKKIKSLIWFKGSTNNKQYIKLIKNEMKKCHIIKNFYFNNKVSFKEKLKYSFKYIFSSFIYIKNYKK